MKLVEGAKQAYKWFSMQAMAVATAIVSTWAMLPTELKAMIPAKYMAGITATVLVAGMVGRLLKQGEDDD